MASLNYHEALVGPDRLDDVTSGRHRSIALQHIDGCPEFRPDDVVLLRAGLGEDEPADLFRVTGVGPCIGLEGSTVFGWSKVELIRFGS